MSTPEDDDLRDLLHDAVSDVDPAHRLDEIRSRTGRSSRRGRYAAGGAALLVAATVTVVTSLGGVGHRAGAPAVPATGQTCDVLEFGPSPLPRTTTPVTCPPTSSAIPTSPSPHAVPPDDGAAVARGPATVYYVGTTAGGPALFGETHDVTTPRADPAQGDYRAVIAALMSAPDDPDYTTRWPAGSITSAGYVEGEFRVYLGNGAPMRDRLARQQLIYSLDASIGRRSTATVYLPGVTSELAGLHADPQLDVLAPVDVLLPRQDQEVAGSFTASGLASSFEGTVPWQVLDAHGVAVRQGAAQAGGDLTRLTLWRTTVDVSSLAPGTYTFVASTDDPTGGTEGPGPTSDTRTVVVR